MELLSAGANAKRVGNFNLDTPARATNPDAVMLYYPYCGFLNSTARRTWSYKGPLFLLTADADASGAGEECRKAVAHARGGMDSIEVHDFAANTHAFDEADQVPGSQFKYDPQATERSLALFTDFIRRQADRLKTGS